MSLGQFPLNVFEYLWQSEKVVYIKQDTKGNIEGFYPLNSSFVTYLESSESGMDDTGNLFVKFNFRGGQE